MSVAASFKLGNPQSELLPLTPLLRACDELLTGAHTDCLVYGDVQGSLALRQEILSQFNSYYGDCRTHEILLTYGISEAITLAARSFVQPDDIVIVEAPTYLWALPEFRAQGAEIVQIPTDDQGLRVDLLESELERAKRSGKRVKLIYCMPTFHNPSGATLALPRRNRLLELAREYEVIVLEDDPYFKLRYRGSDLPPLIALDRDGRVIHFSSFSKLVAPGVRIGWLLTHSPQLLESVVKLKPNGTNPMLAAAMLNYLRTGALRDHLLTIRNYYQQSHEICSSVLAKLGSLNITACETTGGFYFWLRLPRDWSADDFAKYAGERRLEIFSGNSFFAGAPTEQFVRLAFSSFTHAELREKLDQFAGIATEYQHLKTPCSITA
jgi:2-aminoadipate transaminase